MATSDGSAGTSGAPNDERTTGQRYLTPVTDSAVPSWYFGRDEHGVPVPAVVVPGSPSIPLYECRDCWSLTRDPHAHVRGHQSRDAEINALSREASAARPAHGGPSADLAPGWLPYTGMPAFPIR